MSLATFFYPTSVIDELSANVSDLVDASTAGIALTHEEIVAVHDRTFTEAFGLLLKQLRTFSPALADWLEQDFRYEQRALQAEVAFAVVDDAIVTADNMPPSELEFCEIATAYAGPAYASYLTTKIRHETHRDGYPTVDSPE